MKVLLKAIKILFSIILGLLIIINLTFFIKYRLLNNKIPNIFGYGILEVQSGSMSPTLKVNDKIMTKDSSKFKENDIVVYIDETNNLVTHRLIEIKKDEYIMKGDANNTTEVVKKSACIAKVVWYGKKCTDLLSVINNRIIMMLLLIIVFLIPSKGGMKNEKENEIKTQKTN